MRKSLSKGFTLIELLVVIAVIGLLASVVLNSLNSGRAKSRDARRKEDVQQMMNALALYFNVNGNYPSGGLGTTNTTTGLNSPWAHSGSTDPSWTALETALSSYIKVLPRDPKPNNATNIWGGSGTSGQYSYFSFNTGYMIVYSLEVGSVSVPGVNCAGYYHYGGVGSNVSSPVVTIGQDC